MYSPKIKHAIDFWYIHSTFALSNWQNKERLITRRVQQYVVDPTHVTW